VLRFDFTGLGESQGDFSDTTFTTNVDDLVSAAQFLESEYKAPRILIGHSLGGAAVLQAAANIPSARAVVTIGAPADPAHVKQHFTGALDELERTGEAEVKLAGRPFRIKKRFVDDLDAVRMENTIGRLGRALLVMHAPLDDIVGIDNAAGIFTAARHPKSFVSLDEADHLLSSPADSQYAGSVIAAWARKYLPDKGAAVQDRPADDSRVTARTGKKGYSTEISVNGHSLMADEPKGVGGTDLGPTPYDLLAAALGACTTMTLRMYADRKGWPLKGATARLRHKKIHADDCRECETASGKVDHIDRELELTGPLDDDQRRRLLEIADRCPVHRTLHSEIHVTTRLAEADEDFE
jgi:putative redox protein